MLETCAPNFKFKKNIALLKKVIQGTWIQVIANTQSIFLINCILLKYKFMQSNRGLCLFF